MLKSVGLFQNQEHCFLGAVVIGKFDVVKKMLKEGYNIDSLDEVSNTFILSTRVPYTRTASATPE